MSHNRLGSETSPYLLQHADNPVHWWPWGPEALAEAERRGVPILLSVGYSACHWCHVMAHESFEDEGVAELMNRLFVNIKVDREERPDLDTLYQNALALTGRHGGWPLTMFLTPRGEPFWGGTYFPKQARWGQPAFPDVLEGVAHSWQNDPDRIRHNVDRLGEALTRLGAAPGTMGLEMEILDQGAADIYRMIDLEDGGTVGAPKFPQPQLFSFLWRMALRNQDAKLELAVTTTLDHLCQGGIYDHLGGGFMRYSTDDHWLVPHFEKMLYDNGLLISLLCKVWRATKKPLYRARVFETIGWLLREMMAEGGAFAAALDADSDGEEGLFYTWDWTELETLLGPEKLAPLARLYGATPHGNWEGRNILHRNHQDGDGDDDALAASKAVLLAAREKRIRPGRDHKVLADWNGMMIKALADAATTFDRPDWLAAAKTAFGIIKDKMGLPGDRLCHSLCRGKAAHMGVIDDYAHMAEAAMGLFQATGERAYLDQAGSWLDAAHRHHWDEVQGGYVQSAADVADVVIRTKPAFDSAVPSGNGAMGQALARMGLLSGEDKWQSRAGAVVDAFSAAVPDQLASMTSLLEAFAMLADGTTLTLAGPAGSSEVAAMAREAATAPALLDAVLRQEAETPSAMLCRASVCQAPIPHAAGLREALARR
jgi:uncharacterized protein YyaL (SSP411 family)